MTTFEHLESESWMENCFGVSREKKISTRKIYCNQFEKYVVAL